MVYTTHKNGDEWGMVYGIAIPTLERNPSISQPHPEAKQLMVCLACIPASSPRGIWPNMSTGDQLIQFDFLWSICSTEE